MKKLWTKYRKSDLIKIGLTGNIGTGKSTILNIFKNNGFFTVKADEIAKTLYYDNKDLKKALIDSFGQDFYLNSGKINKKKLEYILYFDDRAREKFNKIYYPVFKEYQEEYFDKISLNHKILIYESALLVEVGTYKIFDKIILVNCSKEKQIERIKDRKLSGEKIKKILEHQYPFSYLQKYADFIIDTNKSIKKTEKQTKDIIRTLKLFV